MGAEGRIWVITQILPHNISQWNGIEQQQQLSSQHYYNYSLTQQLTITTMNFTIPSYYLNTILGHILSQMIQILFALLKFNSILNSIINQFNHINTLTRYIYDQVHHSTHQINSFSLHFPHSRHERSEWMMRSISIRSPFISSFKITSIISSLYHHSSGTFDLIYHLMSILSFILILIKVSPNTTPHNERSK